MTNQRYTVLARKASLEDMLRAVREYLGREKTLISKPHGIYYISGCNQHYVFKNTNSQCPHWQLVRIEQ